VSSIENYQPNKKAKKDDDKQSEINGKTFKASKATTSKQPAQNGGPSGIQKQKLADAPQTDQSETKGNGTKMDVSKVPYPLVQPSVRDDCPDERAEVPCRNRRTCRAWHQDQIDFVDSHHDDDEGLPWKPRTSLPWEKVLKKAEKAEKDARRKVALSENKRKVDPFPNEKKKAQDAILNRMLGKNDRSIVTPRLTVTARRMSKLKVSGNTSKASWRPNC